MASEIKKFYEFGKFRFDACRLYLEHDGTQVSLPPKSLEALKVLLEEKGKTVTRENFLEKIWAESFVEDANLTVAVSTLRKTLSVYENENFIQTVPRRGYRFVGNAQERIEISDEPIVIERRAVEQLTVEKTSAPAKTNRRVFYLLFALLGLIASVGAFAAWQRGERNGFYPGDNPAADEAFRKGEALMQKRLTVCDSISYFREVIAKDAAHTRAPANLAAALAMCGDPENEAEALVARALALDPNSAEAHATDGFLKMFVHFKWNEAESALRYAVTLDPNSAKAHHWLGVALSIRGRFLEAEGEMRRAIEITPDSPLYRADLCQIHYFENDFVSAISECQKAQEIDPDFLFTQIYLRDIYLLIGDEQKAWEYEARQLSILKHSPEVIKPVEEVFRREGFKGLYQIRIQDFLEKIRNDNSNPTSRHLFTLIMADYYARIGDRENTLHWLEQAFSGESKSHPFLVAYLGVEPRYTFLRDDARFQAILRKINLSD